MKKLWEWEENSILYATSPYVPTGDIFQAVCHELGRYYHDKGLKYVKSKRELKWKGNNIWCKFGLWSSHCNRQGEWVIFEIVTSIWSIDLSGMERKGILSFGINPKSFNVYQIDNKKFCEIIHFIDNILEMIKSLDTKEGMENYLLTTSEQVFCDKNPNNLQYLRNLGFNH